MPQFAINRPKRIPLWEKTLQEQIGTGRAIPLISSKVVQDMFLGGQEQLVQDYAEYVMKTVLEIQQPDLDFGNGRPSLRFANYIRCLRGGLETGRTELPSLTGDDLLEISRFKLITDDEIETETNLRQDYLDFLKHRFYDLARSEQIPDHLLQVVETDFTRLALSEFPDKLGFPDFEDKPNHPLMILASFPFSIYLTTSHHNFIERALYAAGREPRTEFCRWRSSLALERYPSVFESESRLIPGRKYEPSDKEPLVFHLFGVDTHPDSLVLTDDDCLHFLIAISRNQARPTDSIPTIIRGALAFSPLMLLGYELNSWEFRILYWGLIEPRTVDPDMEQLSISIQVEPTSLEKKFFEKYLYKRARCMVKWGTVDEYTEELQSYRH